jgi:hypothetical protein
MSSGRVFKICAAAIAAFLSMPGAGHAISPKQMIEWCKPVVEAVPLPDGNVQFAHTYESGFCWGTFKLLQDLGHLAVGAADGSLNYQKASFIGPCFPDGTTQEIVRMVRVFDAYVRNHPERQQGGVLWIAQWALTPVFPCK